jgi:hypothetical protein
VPPAFVAKHSPVTSPRHKPLIISRYLSGHEHLSTALLAFWVGACKASKEAAPQENDGYVGAHDVDLGEARSDLKKGSVMRPARSRWQMTWRRQAVKATRLQRYTQQAGLNDWVRKRRSRQEDGYWWIIYLQFLICPVDEMNMIRRHETQSCIQGRGSAVRVEAPTGLEIHQKDKIYVHWLRLRAV